MSAVDSQLRSALWHAAANGNPALIESLVAEGAIYSEQDKTLVTPLGVACQGGQVCAVKLLLRLRANVEGHGSLTAPYTPLMLAAIGGHSECVELLLKNDANIDFALERRRVSRSTCSTLHCRVGHCTAEAAVHSPVLTPAPRTGTGSLHARD